MDEDKNTGRGEQVTDHYLSGAVTNYGKKFHWIGKFEEDTTNNNLFIPSFSLEVVDTSSI